MGIPTLTQDQASNTDVIVSPLAYGDELVATRALPKPRDIEIEASLEIADPSIPEFTVEKQYIIDDNQHHIEDVIPVNLRPRECNEPEPSSPKGNKVQISVISTTVVDRLFSDDQPAHRKSTLSLAIDETSVSSGNDLCRRLQSLYSICTNEANSLQVVQFEPPPSREVTKKNMLLSLDAHRIAMSNNSDPVFIGDTAIILFQKITTYLESITYLMVVRKDSSWRVDDQETLKELVSVKSDLQQVKQCLNDIQTNASKWDDNHKMEDCVNMLFKHVNALETLVEDRGARLWTTKLCSDEFDQNINVLLGHLQSYQAKFNDWLALDSSLEDKLKDIESYEYQIMELQENISNLMENRIEISGFRHTQRPSKEILAVQELSSRLLQDTNLEKNRLDQLVNLTNEYQQTLNEFSKIIDIADVFVQSKIMVHDYDSLQSEIQKHRKFFVNLSQCKSILNSLEEHLDTITRDRHFPMHQTLHDRATSILDKASDKAQVLTLAASKWMQLEKGIREESQWLQIVPQRIPDLSTVSSEDYDRYLTMFQTLYADLRHHHALWIQLTTISVRVQELITAPTLEKECNQSLFIISQLKDNVQRDLGKLLKFHQNWKLYEEAVHKLELWMSDTESQLSRVDIPKFSDLYPLEHLRIFWEIKAQFELHMSIKNDAQNNLEQSLRILPVSDETLQRGLWDRLQQKWIGIDDRINQIFNNITSSITDSHVPETNKLNILQQELAELDNNLKHTKGVIKNQGELQLYIERLQILNKRITVVGTELGQLGLKAYADSEKIGELFTMAHSIAMEIAEELDSSILLQEQFNRIAMGIIKIQLFHKTVAETLTGYETMETTGSDVIENMLQQCERCHQEMALYWQEIMRLRQMLHTIPQTLKLSVSPVLIEREISQLQDNNDILEGRCGNLTKNLMYQRDLWRSFEEQLEDAEKSIHHTDYTIELLKVHGELDFGRLIKATERLQSLFTDLSNREHKLAGLKLSAATLKDCCSEAVVESVDRKVQDTVRAWANTESTLSELCGKYQRAVKLWTDYKTATDALTQLFEESVACLDTMDPNETFVHIEDYAKKIPTYKRKLEEIQQIVKGIATELELDSANLLKMEVDAMTTKLDHIQESIIKLSAFAEERAERLRDLHKDIQATSARVQEIAKYTRDPGSGKDIGQLIVARENLLKLGPSRSQLQTYQVQDLSELPVPPVFELWQTLFKDTLLQYYRLSSNVVKDTDVTVVIELWNDYLKHVKMYLSTPIPSNILGLAEDQYICEVHQNLLTDQMNAIEKQLSLEHGCRLSPLVINHNDNQNGLQMRLVEIKNRSNNWTIYNGLRDEICIWLRRLEHSRQSIPFYYLNLKRIPMIKLKIQNILAKLPEGEDKILKLKAAEQNLSHSADDPIKTSMKIIHSAMEERIDNVKAGLKTWLGVANQIQDLEDMFKGQVQTIQDGLTDCQHVYLSTSQLNLVSELEFKEALDVLKRKKQDIYHIRVDIEKMVDIFERLKERISPQELKSMRQLVCLLGHQCDDMEQQYAGLISDCLGKRALIGMFNERYTYLNDWMVDLEQRINRFGLEMSYVSDVEGVQRCIDDEIKAEISKKERDRDWMVCVGQQLLTLFSDAKQMDEASDIQFKLNDILRRWDSVQALSKSRSSELADMKVTFLKLELRIAELRTWLTHMEKEFAKPTLFEDASERSFKLALEGVSKLQREIENESLNFSEVLNLCDMLFSDINIWKSHFNMGALSVATESIERRWKHLCHLPTDRKRQIMSVWAIFQELQRAHAENFSWLEDRLARISLLEPPVEVSRASVAEYLGMLNVEVHEFQVKEVVRLNLETSYRQLFVISCLDSTNIVKIFQNVKDLLARWSKAIESINCMENEQSNNLANFLDLHEDTIMRLAQIDATWTNVEITQLHETVREKKISDVVTQLNSAELLIIAADDTGKLVQALYADKRPIQKLMDEYHHMYADIRNRVQIASERGVTEEQRVQAGTLTEFTKKDAYILELKGALKEAEINLDSFEKAIQDPKTVLNKPNKIIGACESSVELIDHLRKIIQEECNGTDKESQVVEVDRYLKIFQDLMAKWKCLETVRVEKSENTSLTCPLCTQKNWYQIDNDLWRLEQWLLFAEGIQKNQSTPPTNIGELEDVIQDHREFLLDLNSHKSIVSSLNIVGEHLATHTLDTDKAHELQDRLLLNNQRWESVCRSATYWQSKLQNKLMDNKEFHKIIDELCSWLEDTETKIRSAEPVDLSVDMESMLLKFQQFKELRSELVRCEPRVCSLQEAADQLLKVAENTSDDTSTAIYVRLSDLRLRLQSLRRLTGVYVIKLSTVLGIENADMETAQSQQLDSYVHLEAGTQSTPQLNENPQEINTTVLARGYRFMGRVLRASLPIQALMLLLLGVATLVPHGEDYSCIFTNNFARSLEPMLRYPNGPPPM